MTHLNRRKLLTCRFGENRRSLHRPVQKLPAARLPTAFTPAAATPAFFRFPTSPTGPTAIEDAGTVLSSCLRHAAGAIRMVLGAFRQMKASDLSICRKPALPASARSKAVDSKAAYSFQTARCNGDAQLVPLGLRFPIFRQARQVLLLL